MKRSPALTPDWRYLLVQVGAFQFALPRGGVAGVSRLHPLVLLPHFSRAEHPPIHLGASLISLRPFFDHPEWIGPDSCVVYVPAPGAAADSLCLGLIVDALPSFLSLGETEFKPTTIDLPGAHAIAGTVRLGSRAVHLVDLDALLRPKPGQEAGSAETADDSLRPVFLPAS